MNQLILGDNLEIMQKMDSESIDLIYLDPPFFSNRNYEVIWGDKGEIRSFEDRWSGGVDHYIAWLKERVAEMHRLLKPTGSIYLHCDWHADAYIRVMILDRIFGENNFRNHIIWKRKTGRGESNSKSHKFGTCTDSILFYSKTPQNSAITFNSQYSFEAVGYQDYLDSTFNLIDENGRKYAIDNLSSPSYRANLIYEYKGYKPPKNGWAISREKMEEWDKAGKLFFPNNIEGRIRRKRYLDEVQGKPIQNIWDDIKQIESRTNEAIGYPTQKPEKLLERIILASSNEGDVVFDPFVGGGTTIVVAEKLNRQWIGIDQSVQAVKVSEMRLNKMENMFSAPFTVQLHKYDYDTLRYKDAFEFEKWIVERFNGVTNIKQRSDFGMDRKMRNGTPIQVKRSDGIGRNVVDNFLSAVMRYDKNIYDKNVTAGEPVGYIIAFSFGKGAIQEVARLKNAENVIIKLVTVEEIVPIAKKPKLMVNIADKGADAKGIREIEFTAIGESPAGVEFYAFDFDYNPDTKIFAAELMLNKEGVANWKFKPGQHTIAVKTVDNEGLEAIEVLKIKVNGVVEREE
ncbi:MAG: site-specific DNA-methyltransferase [bacterium]